MPNDLRAVVNSPPRMTNSSHTAGSTAVMTISATKNPATNPSGSGVAADACAYPVAPSSACHADDTPSVKKYTNSPSGSASKK